MSNSYRVCARCQRRDTGAKDSCLGEEDLKHEWGPVLFYYGNPPVTPEQLKAREGVMNLLGEVRVTPDRFVEILREWDDSEEEILRSLVESSFKHTTGLCSCSNPEHCAEDLERSLELALEVLRSEQSG